MIGTFNMKLYAVEAGYRGDDRGIHGLYATHEEALEKATDVAITRILSGDSATTDITAWEGGNQIETVAPMRDIYVGIVRESKKWRDRKELVFEFDRAEVNEFKAVLRDSPTTGDAICVGTDQVEVLQKITTCMRKDGDWDF